MSTESRALEEALQEAQRAARQIAQAAERLRAEGGERLDVRGVGAQLAEMSEAMDEMRARFVQQVEELLPAPPIEEMYARLGTEPASEEEFDRFLAGQEIPADGR